MRKLSLPVIGAGVAGVLALGVGGAVASGAIGVQPTSDESVYVAPSDTPAATTTDAPAEVAAETTSAPVAPPVVETPAATVDAVITPAQKPPTSRQVVDPESIGTTGTDGNYTPAPPRVNPGDPPVGNLGSSGGGDVAPLEGEPGYTGPVLEPQH